MPYSPQHKARTRERILAVAARLFRERGYENVSIDQLMAAAGRTRGGFYAHFSSKQALLTAVIERDQGLQTALRQARRGETGERTPADAMADYLDPARSEGIACDCPVLHLTADVRRVGGDTARAYAEKFAELVAELECATGDRAAALGIAAMSIGAENIAATLGSEPQADELLATCQHLVQRIMRRDGAGDEEE